MPKSKKSRFQKKTILIVGEGKDEHIFFQHLGLLYNTRESRFHIKPDHGNGGSPKHIIEGSIRRNSTASYDERYILIDSDVEPCESFMTLCHNHNYNILQSAECFSCELAKIASISYRHTNKGCKAAVRRFLSEHNPTDLRAIQSKYPKEFLEKKQYDIPLLDKLLQLFKNGSLDET